MKNGAKILVVAAGVIGIIIAVWGGTMLTELLEAVLGTVAALVIL